jgi:drug/metabolite transporter (DMT)-like permease
VWPVVLMLLSVPLLNQRLTTQGVISLLVSFGGVLLLSTQGRLRDFSIAEPLGITLALASSVVWSLYWIINMRDKRTNINKLFLSFLFSFLYIVLTAATTGNLNLPVGKSFFASVYSGVFEMGLTFILWLSALKCLKTQPKFQVLYILHHSCHY